MNDDRATDPYAGGPQDPAGRRIAGMVFSVLLIVVFWLLRSAVPADPQEPGSWLNTASGKIALALNLVPFAGIAFLWFIGVLRDRLGEHEDRFFATVFFGSGLLFLAMLFAAAALAGALITSFVVAPTQLVGSATFHFARAAVYNIMNIYALKTAGVFMITTSTIAIYTGFTPRWLAILGYALAPVLLFGSYHRRGVSPFSRCGCCLSASTFFWTIGPYVRAQAEEPELLLKYVTVRVRVPELESQAVVKANGVAPRRAGGPIHRARRGFPRKIERGLQKRGGGSVRAVRLINDQILQVGPQARRHLDNRQGNHADNSVSVFRQKKRGCRRGNHGVQLGRGDRPAGGCELGQQRRHSLQQIGGRLSCDFNCEICH